MGLPLLFYQAETFGIVPPAEPEDGENEAIKPLPDRLVTELAAYRTDQTFKAERCRLLDTIGRNSLAVQEILILQRCKSRDNIPSKIWEFCEFREGGAKS